MSLIEANWQDFEVKARLRDRCGISIEVLLKLERLTPEETDFLLEKYKNGTPICRIIEYFREYRNIQVDRKQLTSYWRVVVGDRFRNIENHLREARTYRKAIKKQLRDQ